jgi:hypothetical protein
LRPDCSLFRPPPTPDHMPSGLPKWAGPQTKKAMNYRAALRSPRLLQPARPSHLATKQRFPTLIHSFQTIFDLNECVGLLAAVEIGIRKHKPTSVTKRPRIANESHCWISTQNIGRGRAITSTQAASSATGIDALPSPSMSYPFSETLDP